MCTVSSAKSWVVVAGAMVALASASGPSFSQPLDKAGAKEAQKTFTVTVYKYVEEKWQEQPDSSLKTKDAREALRRATSFKIKKGWTAETDATEDVSEFRVWEYKKDTDGMKGYFAKKEGKEWLEVKADKVYARFEEVKRKQWGGREQWGQPAI